MTVKKPTGSVLNDVLAKREHKLSPYQATILKEMANEGRFDHTDAEETAMAAEIVWQVCPTEEAPKLVVPDFQPPSDEEIKRQRTEYQRQHAIQLAAQVYAGAVPLGESGQRVGEVLVEAAGVIERYLSGNSN